MMVVVMGMVVVGYKDGDDGGCDGYGGGGLQRW